MKNFMDMIGTGNEDDQELSDAINAAIDAIMEADANNSMDTANGLVTMDLGPDTPSKEIDTLQSKLDVVKERKVELEKVDDKGETDAENSVAGMEGNANMDNKETSTVDRSAENLRDVADKKEAYEKSVEELRSFANALKVNSNQ